MFFELFKRKDCVYIFYMLMNLLELNYALLEVQTIGNLDSERGGFLNPPRNIYKGVYKYYI